MYGPYSSSIDHFNVSTHHKSYCSGSEYSHGSALQRSSRIYYVRRANPLLCEFVLIVHIARLRIFCSYLIAFREHRRNDACPQSYSDRSLRRGMADEPVASHER